MYGPGGSGGILAPEVGMIQQNKPYILYRSYIEPPNMDIVTGKFYENDDGSLGELYGWHSLITGLAVTHWPNEDKVIPLPDEDSDEWQLVTK